MKVAWFSCGVSSAMTCWLCRGELDEIHYQHVEDQHPDSLRFLRDVEALVGKPIQSPQSRYKGVANVVRATGSLVGPFGARCTDILKRRERKKWEWEHPGRNTYYWGLDCTEKRRVEGIERAMPQHDHRFPLIERGMDKRDAHELAARLGLKRPAMYDLGYNNNNCIGCLKGGVGYWNKIRRDFPEVYARRAKLERDLGRFILKDKHGNPMWLDELDPIRGKEPDKIDCESCGIMCEIAAREGGQP